MRVLHFVFFLMIRRTPRSTPKPSSAASDVYKRQIIHTAEKINSDDEPVRAIRRKKQASMVLAAQAVKQGEAAAMVSLGSTGALLAAGLFIICLLYTSPSPRDRTRARMPSSA
ncbi:fatty acid/phospholipid synthesis protein [Lactobacillus casei subsp. casei ATCC 393] [Lacticaseibacillus rhamnosus]|nr:fatty acid/phospholipid synthesis protein [Lactobacillus casei subsp. casei ATCC 393] [Lacticaseibacillus rhamnosus]